MTIAHPEGTHLAHFNWATLIADYGSPEIAAFETAVPKVNALAERSPGFVWRHGEEREAGLALGWSIFSENPRSIGSFSVWESPTDLTDYVYKTVHGAFFRRSAEWFVPGSGRHVLWWVSEGQIPDIAEARERVMQLDAEGPTARAFTFAALGPDGGETPLKAG